MLITNLLSTNKETELMTHKISQIIVSQLLTCQTF